MVAGVPTKSYKLPTEWIQPNTIVVNVASYKNVDEESLLKVDGVQYIPMVGKVTVAMLERNLMRLYENFHHPDRRLKVIDASGEQSGKAWYGSVLQMYTAVVATGILALLLSKK